MQELQQAIYFGWLNTISTPDCHHVHGRFAAAQAAQQEAVGGAKKADLCGDEDPATVTVENLWSFWALSFF
jgi:hypothetical protein